MELGINYDFKPKQLTMLNQVPKLNKLDSDNMHQAEHFMHFDYNDTTIDSLAILYQVLLVKELNFEPTQNLFSFLAAML